MKIEEQQFLNVGDQVRSILTVLEEETVSNTFFSCMATAKLLGDQMEMSRSLFLQNAANIYDNMMLIPAKSKQN